MWAGREFEIDIVWLNKDENVHRFAVIGERERRTLQERETHTHEKCDLGQIKNMG